jgi:hypothetical protein
MIEIETKCSKTATAMFKIPSLVPFCRNRCELDEDDKMMKKIMCEPSKLSRESIIITISILRPIWKFMKGLAAVDWVPCGHKQPHSLANLEFGRPNFAQSKPKTWHDMIQMDKGELIAHHNIHFETHMEVFKKV